MSSHGFDLTLADSTSIGSAASLEAAASLAAGVFSRTGASVVVTSEGAEVLWVGAPPGPPVPPSIQMTLSAEVDPEDPQLFSFSLAGAPAETGINFGDGQTGLLPGGQTLAPHTYADPGTYHVTAVSGAEFAEVYVTAGAAPELPLQLLSLEPTSAELGGEDLTLVVNGSGFDPGATIVFNGGDEPTVYLSNERVTTLVKPSTATTAGEYPVQVRNADGGLSNELLFGFVEAPPA